MKLKVPSSLRVNFENILFRSMALTAVEEGVKSTQMLNYTYRTRSSRKKQKVRILCALRQERIILRNILVELSETCSSEYRVPVAALLASILVSKLLEFQGCTAEQLDRNRTNSNYEWKILPICAHSC